jgi:hypothetical protein
MMLMTCGQLIEAGGGTEGGTGVGELANTRLNPAVRLVNTIIAAKTIDIKRFALLNM